MRYLYAACLLLAFAGPASAQLATGDGRSDSNWTPPNFGLSGTSDAGGTGIRPLAGQGQQTTTQVTPPVVQPKPKTAVWKWADYQVCITTCTAYGCDSNQWQVCEGEACTLKERGCYAVWNQGVPGGFSVAPGTVASDSCYGMITTKNAALCMR